MTLPKTFRTDRLTKWHVLAALVMGALGVAATLEAWHDIYTLASKDEEYSHIILVPFGVAFPLITLIANYRAIKNGDHDALRLARRWSKVMAVLFAVGAVTGTVLSFEMGLLWPGLFDRFGAVIEGPANSDLPAVEE